MNLPIDTVIPAGSPLFEEIHRIANKNMSHIAQLGGSYLRADKIRAILTRITGTAIDASVVVNLPLYSDTVVVGNVSNEVDGRYGQKRLRTKNRQGSVGTVLFENFLETNDPNSRTSSLRNRTALHR